MISEENITRDKVRTFVVLNPENPISSSISSSSSPPSSSLLPSSTPSPSAPGSPPLRCLTPFNFLEPLFVSSSDESVSQVQQADYKPSMGWNTASCDVIGYKNCELAINKTAICIADTNLHESVSSPFLNALCGQYQEALWPYKSLLSSSLLLAWHLFYPYCGNVLDQCDLDRTPALDHCCRTYYHCVHRRYQTNDGDLGPCPAKNRHEHNLNFLYHWWPIVKRRTLINLFWTKREIIKQWINLRTVGLGYHLAPFDTPDSSNRNKYKTANLLS